MSKLHVIFFLLPCTLLFILSGCGNTPQTLRQDGSNAKVIISKNFDCKLHKRIAIMPIKTSGNVPEGISEGHTEAFSLRLMEMGFILVERTLLDKILDELKLEDSGILSDKELSRVGNLLHIDMIVYGSVQKIAGGGTFESLRFIDVKTGEVLISVRCPGMTGKSMTKEISLALRQRLSHCQ